MNYKIILIFFYLMAAFSSYSQEQHSIKNVSLLYPLFEKLVRLEKNKDGKVNIVHVGDSHIQADIFTNVIREPLQQQFGDGGHGFIFPYTLNKTINGPYTFFSNAVWQTCKNSLPTRCSTGTELGLSGYGFSTKTEQFVLSVEANDDKYNFNTIKIASPATSSYRLAIVDGDKKPIIYKEKTNVNIHNVKKGETIDIIAKNYNVSAAAIKKENKMKSNYIRRKNLRIPITITESSIDTSMFRQLEYPYHQDKPISAIYLLPTQKQAIYNLNGLIVEKDVPGLIYHAIGTIGSTASNFNANPLFFEQFPLLSPDLVIISFGTNESFNNLSAENFIASLEQFINNIRRFCPNVPVLVTTPQLSYFPRKKFNTYILEYSNALLQKDNIAIWDLYSYLKHLIGPDENLAAIKIANDKVHYTLEGYVNQGNAFVSDFLNEYEHYKRSLE